MRSRPTAPARRAIGFGWLVLATVALIVPGAGARQARHYARRHQGRSVRQSRGPAIRSLSRALRGQWDGIS